jgi:hypothetical protein
MTTAQRDLPSEPITEGWLKANGFKRVCGREWCRRVTQMKVDVYVLMEEPFVMWLGCHHDGPVKVTETWQVIRLIEGLTGKQWGGDS